MPRPHLASPAVGYRRSYLEALQEFQAEGRLLELEHGAIAADFGAFVREKLQPTLTGTMVPQTVYWLVEAGEYLGRLSIRHRLNENLRRVGGHIGYEIRPSRRREGHGRLILELGLQKAAEMGLERVLLTCDVTNLGSSRIIVTNGGVLENELEGKLRYWIAVPSLPST